MKTVSAAIWENSSRQVPQLLQKNSKHEKCLCVKTRRRLSSAHYFWLASDLQQDRQLRCCCPYIPQNGGNTRKAGWFVSRVVCTSRKLKNYFLTAQVLPLYHRKSLLNAAGQRKIVCLEVLQCIRPFFFFCLLSVKLGGSPSPHFSCDRLI